MNPVSRIPFSSLPASTQVQSGIGQLPILRLRPPAPTVPTSNIPGNVSSLTAGGALSAILLAKDLANYVSKRSAESEAANMHIPYENVRPGNKFKYGSEIQNQDWNVYRNQEEEKKLSQIALDKSKGDRFLEHVLSLDNVNQQNMMLAQELQRRYNRLNQQMPSFSEEPDPPYSTFRQSNIRYSTDEPPLRKQFRVNEELLSTNEIGHPVNPKYHPSPINSQTRFPLRSFPRPLGDGHNENQILGILNNTRIRMDQFSADLIRTERQNRRIDSQRINIPTSRYIHPGGENETEMGFYAGSNIFTDEELLKKMENPESISKEMREAIQRVICFHC